VRGGAHRKELVIIAGDAETLYRSQNFLLRLLNFFCQFLMTSIQFRADRDYTFGNLHHIGTEAFGNDVELVNNFFFKHLLIFSRYPIPSSYDTKRQKNGKIDVANINNIY
jgi:hypothetical protein